MGKQQTEALEWIRQRGGSVHAPRGDRVLRSLVDRGALMMRNADVITGDDVRDFGKVKSWRPRPGTWARFTFPEEKG